MEMVQEVWTLETRSPHILEFVSWLYFLGPGHLRVGLCFPPLQDLSWRASEILLNPSRECVVSFTVIRVFEAPRTLSLYRQFATF